MKNARAHFSLATFSLEKKVLFSPPPGHPCALFRRPYPASAPLPTLREALSRLSRRICVEREDKPNLERVTSAVESQEGASLSRCCLQIERGKKPKHLFLRLDSTRRHDGAHPYPPLDERRPRNKPARSGRRGIAAQEAVRLGCQRHPSKRRRKRFDCDDAGDDD